MTQPATSTPGPGAQVRTALWLRSAQTFSSPWRRRAAAVAVLAWFVAVAGLTWNAHRVGTISTSDLGAVTGAVWALLAIVPLLGAGGGDMASPARLAPYPTSTAFDVAYVTSGALTDVPFLVFAPVIVGVGAALGGPAGVVAAAVFLVVAVASGQVTGALSAMLTAGRRYPWVPMLAVIGAGSFTLSRFPGAAGAITDVASAGPPAWFAAAASGDSPVGAGAALVASALVAVVAAGFTNRAARRRDLVTSAPGAQRRHRLARPGSFVAVAAAHARSMRRAAVTQAALAAVVVAPVAVRVHPSVDVGGLAVAALAMLAVAGVAGTQGLNVVAFSGGGVRLLTSSPMPRWQVAAAVAAGTGVIEAAAALTIVTVGAVVVGLSAPEVVFAASVSVLAVVPLAMSGLVWSLRHPRQVDFDSLRAKVASPRSVMTFVPVNFAQVGILGYVAAGNGILGAAGVAGIIGAWWSWRAARLMGRWADVCHTVAAGTN